MGRQHKLTGRNFDSATVLKGTLEYEKNLDTNVKKYLY